MKKILMMLVLAAVCVFLLTACPPLFGPGGGGGPGRAAPGHGGGGPGPSGPHP